MTGEIVNLRRERKRRGKAVEGEKAAANRGAFGQSKAAKALADAERSLTERQLAGHRRVSPPDHE